MTAIIIPLRPAVRRESPPPPPIDYDSVKLMERVRLIRQVADMWSVDLRFAAAIKPQGRPVD